MKRFAGSEGVAENTPSTRKRNEEENSSYAAVMGLPADIFDEEKIEASIPNNAYNESLGHSETISESIALQLIGENQRKPNCVYKLVSTMHHTCVTQYDTSKSPDDPDYCTEYELEEYREGYKPGIDEMSVSSGFWQADDVPKSHNAMVVMFIILFILFIIGVGVISFTLSLVG